MPIERIDLGKGSYSNVDEVSTREGVSPAIWNGYLDDLGSNVKVWGAESWCSFTSDKIVHGMFFSTTLGYLIAVADGNVYKVDSSGTETLLGSGIFSTTTRVSFTESPAVTLSGSYSPLVFMCNGGNIYYTDGSTVIKIDTGVTANAPSACGTVLFIDYQLVAQYDRRFFVHSEPLDLLNFGDSTNIVAADSSPDDIVGMEYRNRELIVFGKRSIDTFYYSSLGSSASWLKTPGGFQETGCAARASIVRIENAIYFLNHRREICRYAGRQIQVISTSLTKELQDFGTVSDAYADRVDYNGKHFYWLTLPSQGKSLVYDIQLDCWYFMGDWNAGPAKYDIHPLNAFAYDDVNNLYLVGTKRGVIQRLTNTTGGSTGYQNTNRFLRTTGYINHGSDVVHKRCNRITFRVKSGYEFTGEIPSLSTEAAEYAFMVRFRDEDQEWSNWLYPSLKPIGNHDFVAELRPMGIYRARQWQIAQTDNCPFVLVSMEEDYDVLR